MSEVYIVLQCTSVGIIWLLIVKKNFDVETVISDYYPMHSLFTLHSHGQLFFFLPFFGLFSMVADFWSYWQLLDLMFFVQITL